MNLAAVMSVIQVHLPNSAMHEGAVGVDCSRKDVIILVQSVLEFIYKT